MQADNYFAIILDRFDHYKQFVVDRPATSVTR